MKFKLILKKENDIVESTEISHFPFRIGRGDDNELVLLDQHISRQHAKLVWKEDEMMIEKTSKTGKLLIEGKDIADQQPLTLPCTFEIPPYAISVSMVQEKEETPKEEIEAKEEPFPVILDAEEEVVSTPPETRPVISEDTQISQHQVRAKLIILEGKSPHESYDLIGKEIILGRDEGCDIFIDDEKISRSHAKIYQKGKSYWIEDLKSTNGTLLNHKIITKPIELTSSDQIQIGNAKLQFAVIDENVFALSSATQETSLSSDTTYSQEISSYHYPVQKRFTTRTKIMLGMAGTLILTLAYLKLIPTPPPTRTTATETPIRRERTTQVDELLHLTNVDKQYVLAKIEEAKNAYKNRNYFGAQIALQEALKIAPDYTQAKKLLEVVSQTLAQQEQVRASRQAQLEAEKLKEEIKLHLSLALDYFNRGQWDKAIEVYDKILELSPEQQEAHKKRKIAYEKLYKKPKAEAKVSQRQKRNKTAERFLAEGSKFNQKNEKLKALETWRKVLRIENIDPQYYAQAEQFINFTKEELKQKYFPLITQIKGLIESKEYLQAKYILDKILADYPTHAEALKLKDKILFSLHGLAKREYTEAIIDENVGRVDAAIQRYKWIIEKIPPDDEYHQKAKRKLSRYE